MDEVFGFPGWAHTCNLPDVHQNDRTLLLPDGAVAKARDLADWPEPRAMADAT